MSRAQIEEEGGRGLLHHHKSLEAVLRAVYPEHDWDSSRFLRARIHPRGHSSDREYLLSELDKVEKRLGILKANTLSLYICYNLFSPCDISQRIGTLCN